MDTGYDGGFCDTETPMQLVGPEAVPLEGNWAYRIGADLADIDERPDFAPLPLQNQPTQLFNAMIAPLIPYTIRGVIWYQGESNAGRARQYRDLFPAMIGDWRSRWGLGDFPFLCVQIAPYRDQPPEIREAQLLTLDKSPNTAMVVTIDFGDAEGIHPANKEPVGERLARLGRIRPLYRAPGAWSSWLDPLAGTRGR